MSNHTEIQAAVRLAALRRPDGEQHDMHPAHDLCLGDDPCVCIQLYACEQRVLDLNSVALGLLIAQRARERALTAAREAIATADRIRCAEDALAAIDAIRGTT